MKPLHFNVLVLMFCMSLAQNVKIIDRYEKLVKDSIEASNNYESPKDAHEFTPTSSQERVLQDVDFIIIGSGAAGSVLANRLSEITRWTILVLEAGGFESAFTDIPGMNGYIRAGSYNWGYKTVPQTVGCKGMVDRSCPTPRGKGFGGSTIINALRYVRGDKEDYAHLVRNGLTEWSYDLVLPYYRKSENMSLPNVDSGYHGYSGPLHVEYYKPNSANDYLNGTYKPYSAKFQAVVEAYQEMGYNYVDYNGIHQIGISRTQQNCHKGRRVSTAKAFLPAVTYRDNVYLVGNAYVTKILINKKTKTATGVLFSKNSTIYRVRAKKEVILSAGAVMSPHILMHSGIGPANHLKEHNIELIQNLSVGQNLIEHPQFNGLYFNTNVSQSRKTIREYVTEFLNGYGLYTVAVGVEGVGFIQTQNDSTGSPDIELYFVPANPSVNTSIKINGYTNETQTGYNKNMNSSTNLQVSIICLHPKSRGTIKLKSNNTFNYPLIDINFLGDPNGEDINRLYAATKDVLKMMDTKAFSKINPSIGRVVLPGCAQFTYLSEGYWKCLIKHLTSNAHHLMGTCKMGTSPASGAVVNSRLKVFGIKQLRVVDASIFELISGHTSAPTMMLAEKISDVIKLENGVALNELDLSVLNSKASKDYLKKIAKQYGQ